MSRPTQVDIDAVLTRRVSLVLAIERARAEQREKEKRVRGGLLDAILIDCYSKTSRR